MASRYPRAKGRAWWTGAQRPHHVPMPKAAQPSIEDQFLAVEEAVAALASGDLPLEEALSRYESGLKAVRLARAQLDRYAARLDELRAEPGESGTPRDA
jgi:exodeoxyribonuclease VII small subunit